jgi:DNA-binding NarL/FixJ family response regulator
MPTIKRTDPNIGDAGKNARRTGKRSGARGRKTRPRDPAGAAPVPATEIPRVFLVDDNAEFLNSAKQFLAADPRIQIVGSAESGHVAIRQVPVLKPDLVLMDLTMPDMNGLEATRHIKSSGEMPRVIILTLHDNPEYRAAAAAVQADGFVAKSDLGEQLMPMICRMFA